MVGFRLVERQTEPEREVAADVPLSYSCRLLQRAGEESAFRVCSEFFCLRRPVPAREQPFRSTRYPTWVNRRLVSRICLPVSSYNHVLVGAGRSVCGAVELCSAGREWGHSCFVFHVSGHKCWHVSSSADVPAPSASALIQIPWLDPAGLARTSTGKAFWKASRPNMA